MITKIIQDRLEPNISKQEFGTDCFALFTYSFKSYLRSQWIGLLGGWTSLKCHPSPPPRMTSLLMIATWVSAVCVELSICESVHLLQPLFWHTICSHQNLVKAHFWVSKCQPFVMLKCNCVIMLVEQRHSNESNQCPTHGVWT